MTTYIANIEANSIMEQQSFTRILGTGFVSANTLPTTGQQWPILMSAGQVTTTVTIPSAINTLYSATNYGAL